MSALRSVRSDKVAWFLPRRSFMNHVAPLDDLPVFFIRSFALAALLFQSRLRHCSL